MNDHVQHIWANICIPFQGDHRLQSSWFQYKYAMSRMLRTCCEHSLSSVTKVSITSSMWYSHLPVGIMLAGGQNRKEEELWLPVVNYRKVHTSTQKEWTSLKYHWQPWRNHTSNLSNAQSLALAFVVDLIDKYMLYISNCRIIYIFFF